MRDHFILAFSNLRRRGLRSWLTMIGIFIGIAAVVGLISLGQGLQNAIDQQFEALGKNTIIVESKTIGSPGSATGNLVLTTTDLNAIKGVIGVTDAVGILVRYSSVTFKQQLQVEAIIGIDPKDINFFSEAQNFKIIDGRTLKNGDVYKAIIGYSNTIDGKIWTKGMVVGDTININGVDFKVVGVLDKTGNPINDAAIYVPKSTLRQTLNLPDQEDEIDVKVANGFDVNSVANSIENKLLRIKNEKKDQETFTVQTSDQLLSSFTSIFNIVQGVLVGIAAISLLVGGIGIMNTMYTSVLERTKEIGTMKAVGAKNTDILQIFLYESGLLGLVGGSIGVLLGIGLGKGVQYIATIALGTNLLQASITFPLVAGALAFSFFIGSLSGILPAMQAARLKPADALRYE